MAESQGNGLKTAANGLFHKNFEFGPLFWYDNFQNEIDTWETTVDGGFLGCSHAGFLAYAWRLIQLVIIESGR